MYMPDQSNLELHINKSAHVFPKKYYYVEPQPEGEIVS